MKKFNSLQELFADPKRWTKGTFARDKDGKITGTLMPNAVCFCLLGGVTPVYGLHTEEGKAVREKLKNATNHNIAIFNDSPSTTIEDIQKLVKELDV